MIKVKVAGEGMERRRALKPSKNREAFGAQYHE